MPASRHDPLADALADELRPRSVPVEPRALAASLGIRVERRPMAPAVLGAAPSSTRIVINDQLVPQHERFVIAHEFAHILVKGGRASFRDPVAEERFADAFAEALLVPSYTLGPVVYAEEVAERLGVDAAVVRARARRLGRIVRARAA